MTVSDKWKLSSFFAIGAFVSLSACSEYTVEGPFLVDPPTTLSSSNEKSINIVTIKLKGPENYWLESGGKYHKTSTSQLEEHLKLELSKYPATRITIIVASPENKGFIEPLETMASQIGITGINLHIRDE